VLDRVYRAVAWQCIDQIRYNTIGNITSHGVTVQFLCTVYPVLMTVEAEVLGYIRIRITGKRVGQELSIPLF
jgi:hypothetical protein